MNLFIGKGRLTKDPELKYAQNENSTAIARFPIAIPRRFKKDGQPDSDFLNCTAFGKQAEFIEKFFKKGQEALIEGNIQTRSWDGEDSKKHYATDVIVNQIEFCGKKSDNEKVESQGEQNKPEPTNVCVDESDTDLPF